MVDIPAPLDTPVQTIDPRLTNQSFLSYQYNTGNKVGKGKEILNIRQNEKSSEGSLPFSFRDVLTSGANNEKPRSESGSGKRTSNS